MFHIVIGIIVYNNEIIRQGREMAFVVVALCLVSSNCLDETPRRSLLGTQPTRSILVLQFSQT